jgi:hypothetical protein
VSGGAAPTVSAKGEPGQRTVDPIILRRSAHDASRRSQHLCRRRRDHGARRVRGSTSRTAVSSHRAPASSCDRAPCTSPTAMSRVRRRRLMPRGCEAVPARFDLPGRVAPRIGRDGRGPGR